jgi:hypothetical protein
MDGVRALLVKHLTEVFGAPAAAVNAT